mgnify:CR=1 FL=1
MKREQKKKVVIAGNFGVGKTSLIRQFVHSIFSDKYLTTIGVKIDKKSINLDNDLVHLIIWDITGPKHKEKANPLHLKGTHGFIYVCDLSRPSTFEDIDQKINEILNFTGVVPTIRVGNKSDLLSPIKLEKMARQLGLDFTSSAKLNLGVEELFAEMARKFV